MIYFPARISLTSLLVFAGGTDLGAGEGLCIQTLTCNCVFSDAQHRVLWGLWMPLNIPHLE